MSSGQQSERAPQLHLSCAEEGDDLYLCRAEGVVTRDALAQQDSPEQFGEKSCGRKVLLDLSQTSHIDSAGVSWLIRLHRNCESANGRLVIHSVSPVVRRTFDLLNMDAVFLIKEDERAARESVDTG